MTAAHTEKKPLSFLTILSYGLSYGSGYQIMGALVGSYLMVFLTDTFGIPAAAVGVIMVLASIWDAINDPIMGVLADKVHTRFGRYRPFFLFIPALLTVVVVLLFKSPHLSDTGKIIWTAVFYIGYGMLRTAFEVPCNALINAITDEEKERQKLISSYTLIMGIFTTVTTSFALALVSLFGGENTAKGYMMVVGIAGILMTVSCWVCFACTKERFVTPPAKHSLGEQLTKLFSVKGLIPTIIIWLAGYIGYNIMMGSSVYYLLYCLCRPDLISGYMLTISVCGLAGISFFIPLLMRLCKSVKKSFAVSQLGTFACNALCLVLSRSVPAVFVFSGLASLCATMFMVFGSMLMTEISDATFYHTHTIMNGTIAALKGFTNKCGIAVANGVVSGVLAATGYVANAVGQEPQATVVGITCVRFAAPALMALVIVAALRFYPITEEVKAVFAGLYGPDGAGKKERDA